MLNRILLICVAVVLASCTDKPSGDEIMNRQQAAMDRQGALAVGPPAIVNFQEKRTLKMIYELRDTTLSTTTYIVDRYGKTHKVCDSVGYGIPYSTEYTNPEKVVGINTNYVAIPQADPNGLFSPSSAEGTWVLCLDNKRKKVVPVYIEPRIIVSPFELNIK